MSEATPVSGQLILSDRGLILPGNDAHPGERHAIMTFGIIAVPPELAARYADPKGWTQRVVAGVEGLDEDFTRHLGLQIYAEPATALPEHTGCRVDQLLCSRIWRC